MQKGIGIFGKRYEHGFKNETHAPGSVVRVLFDEMIKLENDSAKYLYGSYTDLSLRYEPGSRPILENTINRLKGATNSKTVDNILRFCENLAMRCNMLSSEFIYGGTEEEIIERMTYWCTDVAQVACVLFQVVGLESRIVITANTNFPYCGHTVAEVYYDEKGCLTDLNAGVAFRRDDKTPASAWEAHNNYSIANRVYYKKDLEGYSNSIFFSHGEQFESIGIVNYCINDKNRYDYTTSDTNEFYKKY